MTFLNDPSRPRPAGSVIADVSRILANDVFDEAAVSDLAVRRRYADAAWCLAQEVDPRPCAEGIIVQSLIAMTPLIAANRLAVAIGATEFTTKGFVTVKLLERSKSENSQIILALLGLLTDWHAATYRVRAAYALQSLVRVFRDRA
jgi:hypothetical protein